jgi:hypothetical protein
MTISGNAKCIDCGHEWVQVAPHGTLWLDCQSCKLERGRFVRHCERAGEHFHCIACNNDLFYATREGFYCPGCGEWMVP